MNEYRYIIYDLDWSYENQRNDVAELEAITSEWDYRREESLDLQADLRELGVQIPKLTAAQMWTQATNTPEMEQALLRIRVENNIMALRMARYGMLRVCNKFAEANGRTLPTLEQDMIIERDEYFSNSDDE